MQLDLESLHDHRIFFFYQQPLRNINTIHIILLLMLACFMHVADCHKNKIFFSESKLYTLSKTA